MRDELIKLVSGHEPFDALEKEHTEFTLSFLRENIDCISTANVYGHITASAWVLSPDRTETLLTHHKKLNRWLQLGGHVENDATIQEAAFREAVEESGIEKIKLVQNTIFDIDVHTIPARESVQEHNHFDIRFLFQAESKKYKISAESNELAWIKLGSIEEILSDESVLRMGRKSAACM